MEETKMKNMIVLKNLPSNLIEEAFVIIKSTKKAKDLEKIEKNTKSRIENNINKKNSKNRVEKEDDKYIVKEAEIVISTYIESLEKEESKMKNKKQEDKKHRKLKIYSAITTAIIIMQFVTINLI